MSLLTACLDNPSANRSAGQSDSQGPSEDEQSPTDPTFGSRLNYLQNGSIKSSGALTISKSQSDFFYLGGREVHEFIKSQGAQKNVLCMATYFHTSTDQTVLISTLTPQSFVNFQTSEREHYYLINSIDQNQTRSFCQKAGFMEMLDQEFPSSNYAWELSEACPNCPLNTYQSQPLELFSSSGQKIEQIDTSYLSFRLTNQGASSDIGGSCSSSSHCRALGYDCCSGGQCVNDFQLKDGAEDYPQSFREEAALAILENPSAIFDYPELYHICTIAPYPPPNNPPDIDSDREAQEMMREKRELYECTNPIEGEMGICSIHFDDVSIDDTNQYQTRPDDRSFISTYRGTQGIPNYSLVEAIYAGETLYESGTTPLDGFNIGSGNDNLTSPLTVTLNRAPPNRAINDRLTLRYKVDASCELLNQNIARCRKHYIQGQNKGKVTDHFPGSDNFRLPNYADTNRVIQVQVDGEQKIRGQQWSLTTSPPSVSFQGDNIQVFDTQEVIITFFVDLEFNDVFQSQRNARERINQMCGCTNVECNLKKKIDPSNGNIDYVCDYPDPILPEPPDQQIIMMSSKATPHRYFDQSGLFHSNPNANTVQQEGESFSYQSGNLLKPNNVEKYVGFNEIYGSYNFTATSALPARTVHIKPGTTYDIYVDTGNFNTCHFCGNDYYSNLTRLFPNNFSNPGGGFRPNENSSSKLNPGSIRADDMIFGRACFVPATMIPWTHLPDATSQQQRLSRLKAQHFLFSNGYQRDWYGFDYGSVIGSFDGVKWFSIGNKRRIKSTSNKLFLAINAYFGDLTNTATYSISINEMTPSSVGGSMITDDHNSSGAQCRQFHVCQTDSDCASQLGWEYTCENISQVRTLWPTFDINAREIPGEHFEERLTNLFNIRDGGQRRCVYRGRGAPCSTNYGVATTTNTYSRTDSTQPGLLTCSTNNHCQRISAGVPNEDFNNRITRYGKSVKHQNASGEVEDISNEFGLDSRIIGRPYNYQGNEAAVVRTYDTGTNNNINAICLPGRDPNASTIAQSHMNRPSNENLGDKVNAQGMTLSSSFDLRYKNSCPLFNDQSGQYLYKTLSSNTSLSNSQLTRAARLQAISTNALSIFQEEGLVGLPLTKNFELDFIDEISYQEHRCLRAPGSVCHTEMDCAPNPIIASKLRNLNYDEEQDYNLLNRYEVEFWQQELICSQEYEPFEDDFDLKNNRCCRETGKNLTVGTYIDQTDFTNTLRQFPNFNPVAVPGIDISYSSPRRYSRNSIVSDLIGTSNYPPLESTRRGQCIGASGCKNFDEVRNQWRTLSKINERTCCSGHWIRHFHQENGGGYRWGPSKHQRVQKEGLRCYNWNQCTNPINQCEHGSFTCSHTETPDDINCLIRGTSLGQAKPIFQFYNKLELLGIPQVELSYNDNEIRCSVSPDDQQASSLFGPVNRDGDSLVTPDGDGDFTHGNDLDPTLYVSALHENNFNESLKMTFSKDQFSCCLPPGTLLDDGTDPSVCCTGFINQQTGRCALPDYTNVSLFYNRYVSSAAKDLNLGLFDPDTGYINSPSIVEQLACLQNICASGVLARGVALSNLKVPGHEAENDNYFIRRFIDGNNQSTNFEGKADLFDAGLRWNNQLYCVPEELLELSQESSLQVISCGGI